MPRTLFPAALVLLAAGTALAGGPERVPPITHAATAKECGECHMAFQPGLLPAASWGRIMDGLTDHFGDNATLPPEVAAEIRAYLAGHAGRGDGRLMRITEQRWFVREHDFPATVWNKPDIRSKANCQACHRDAERGNYEDD